MFSFFCCFCFSNVKCNLNIFFFGREREKYFAYFAPLTIHRLPLSWFDGIAAPRKKKKNSWICVNKILCCFVASFIFILLIEYTFDLLYDQRKCDGSSIFLLNFYLTSSSFHFIFIIIFFFFFFLLDASFYIVNMQSIRM